MDMLLEWFALGQDETATVSWDNAEKLYGGLGLRYLWAFWVLAATSLAMAWIAWRLHYAGKFGKGARAFLRFLFPRAIYAHGSTRVDLQLILLNQLFSPVTLMLAALATGVLASWTSRGLFAFMPAHDPDFEWGLLPLAGFTLAIALASDLATYIVHRLYHTVPALWEIHKVHHSAEVMSPLTVFRKHPLFDLAARALKAVFIGPMQGIVFFAFAGPVDALTAFGANLVFGAFHMLGAGLRHSHVWLSYGPVLERVFISPAQHQVHHSKARRHWDRNFGQIFAIWDWIAGTLYVPRGYEELEFGVADAPSEEFSGVWGGILRPVLRAWQVATGRRRGARETAAWRRRQARLARGETDPRAGGSTGTRTGRLP